MKSKWYLPLMILCRLVLVACGGQSAPAATPTIDPAIYNQVPKTTVFEPGSAKWS